MKAIYQVIENGQTSYFRSRIAGGYSYPFFVFEYARRMESLINDNDLLGKVNMAELFPLLKANKDFPENDFGKRLFEPICESSFADYESGMSVNDGIPFNITLDFDKRMIGFVFNQNCPQLIKPKINIFIGRNDARDVFGKRPPLFKDVEKLFEIDLRSYVEERPVFAIRIDSDTISMQGSALLPLSDHNQKGLMAELETDDLNKCEILSVTAFDKALNAHLVFDGEKFSALNTLAETLNRLRMDCGDAAFSAVAAAGAAESFYGVDSAMKVIENVRKGFAMRETQDMDIRM